MVCSIIARHVAWSCAAMCHVAVGSVRVPKAARPGKVSILRRKNLDQSLTDGLAWRACRAGADHPSEHHLPRETFAAHVHFPGTRVRIWDLGAAPARRLLRLFYGCS